MSVCYSACMQTYILVCIQQNVCIYCCYIYNICYIYIYAIYAYAIYIYIQREIYRERYIERDIYIYIYIYIYREIYIYVSLLLKTPCGVTPPPLHFWVLAFRAPFRQVALAGLCLPILTTPSHPYFCYP